MARCNSEFEGVCPQNGTGVLKGLSVRTGNGFVLLLFCRTPVSAAAAVVVVAVVDLALTRRP